MAAVRAIKTGVWSDVTVWNTGALPTAADDVYSNTFTVTIDQDVTVLSIRNSAGGGASAGGSFNCSTGRTIDCSAGSGFLGGSTAAPLLTLVAHVGHNSHDKRDDIRWSGGRCSIPSFLYGYDKPHGNNQRHIQ
jgi:hypothetical protein